MGCYPTFAVHENEEDSEAEWRFIPPFTIDSSFLGEEQFNTHDELSEANEKARMKSPLNFTVNDIRYLFVKTVNEIPVLVDFINSKLGHNTSNDLKILISRIVSLEDLSLDI